MICPVCKKPVEGNTLRCPHCKAVIGLLCKNCNTVNPIQNMTCKNCGKEILKVCSHCASINFLDAKKCRKCSMPFVETINNQQSLKYIPTLIPQKDAIKKLSKGITDGIKLISISGKKGIGKSYVLKETAKNFTDTIWVFGKCTPLTQLTPGGVIQDMVLNIFNLPNFCMNTPEFKKDAIKYFKNEFPQMSNSQLNDLLNFLYSAQEGEFENLSINKHKTFDILYKIFDKISHLGKFVVVVDNFDYIDGFSYEFLHNLISKYDFTMILMYCNPRPVKGIFSCEIESLDISLAPLKDDEINTLNLDDSYINEVEKSEIITKSKGHPAYFEQAVSLCFDCQIAEEPFQLPATFKEIITKRLKLLKELNPPAYKILLGASIMGDKINLALLKEIFKEEDCDGVIDYLRQMNFITLINEIFFEFKNILLWETILSAAKNDKDFIELNTKIAQTLSMLILNSNAVMGIIAQNLKQTQAALDVWTKNTKLAAYVGDTNLYVISQKQCLALINELDESETLKIRYNIAERLGKLLTDYNPTEALDYLPDAISNAKACGNTPKEIELLGYLSYCCRQTNNFYGNIECVDSVLEKVQSDDKLKIALLKLSKLESILGIGNCGEVITTIDNDIMPVLDKFLTKPYKCDFSIEFVYETWLKTYLMLANALIMQGNDRSFEILTIIFDIIERNKITDELFISKCKLALAFANTIKGDFNTSENILDDTLNLYKTRMDNSTVLKWNFIKILNNFFRKRYEGLQEDLFEVVTFADNCKDEFTKNILKTLLGKIFKDNEQAKQAMEIYNSQITYFAKEKLATGALLTWYLIADATLVTEGPHAAIEIAAQALDVAQNPKISNYLFVILLKMIIAKASIVISDYETAKINIENAIILAGKFNMKDLLSRLYLLYGKYFQELGLLTTDKQSEYLKGASKMYEKATEIVQQTRNNTVHIENEKAKKVLKSFCLLHNIKL